MRDPTLDAWGGYDRDNPFPLFARVRAAGPVHEVTLPDGQRAWLVVRHAEARAALNDPRLSKDMHAAGFRVRDEELAGPTQHLCRSPKISIPSVSSGRDHGGEPTAQELARLLGVSPRVHVCSNGLAAIRYRWMNSWRRTVMRHGDLIPAAPQAARRYNSARPAGILKGSGEASPVQISSSGSGSAPSAL